MVEENQNFTKDAAQHDEGLPLDLVPNVSLTTGFFVHECIPSLTLYERVRLDCLTALNFHDFAGNPNIPAIQTHHTERHILFKGFRILEHRVHRLLRDGSDVNETDKIDAFLVFLKLGHICLLSGDYARALSAYQKALSLAKEYFWRDPAAYLGLGLVYMHFKAYPCAVNAFNQQLYMYGVSAIASEVHSRLGVAYKALKKYDKSLKHFGATLRNHKEPAYMNRINTRFNIALTLDSAGNLEQAYRNCEAILADEACQVHTANGVALRAAVERELGWLCCRAVDGEGYENENDRINKLKEAEIHLMNSKALQPESGKTFYYLGRVFCEQTAIRGNCSREQAHDAFMNFRHSIDKSEADADTWCAIGVLYQQQQQPMDALQAFICAVDLDPTHSAAWLNLGMLYEAQNQFVDALKCFKKSIVNKPLSPETLKLRIIILERELRMHPHLTNPPKPRLPSVREQGRLPDLDHAGSQPIPSELRQRQDEFLKTKQQKYRDGSPLWKMGDLAHDRSDKVDKICEAKMALDSTQLNMLKILKYVESHHLDDTCARVKAALEQRFNQYGSIDCVDMPLSHYSIESLPVCDQSNLAALRNFTSIFDIDEKGDSVKRVKVEVDVDAESSDTIDLLADVYTDLPTTFSLTAPLKIPLDVTANELRLQCALRYESPTKFKKIFQERMPPPAPPTPPKCPKPVKNENLRSTPFIHVESRKEAHSIELQRFCETTPVALIRGMTAHLKMDLSLFSTKTLMEMVPDHEVEVRTQYKQHGDGNADFLGVPTWNYISEQSFTTVAKYGHYQAETFKYQLKEESEKLRNMGAKYGAQAESAAAKKRRLMEAEGTPVKVLKFGTNIDLSDDDKFKKQLTELAKMPPFCRVIAGCNLLSHLGHQVAGMNTVQLYMKIPGVRTPGHMENNCLASVNVNIGPGDCEWFSVPYEYWGIIDQKCQELGIDFMTGTWWPNLDDLAQMGVPVYKFTQKAGDLVWVGTGCVHWVQSTGWCNCVAWNVGPISYVQLSMAVQQYEYNKLSEYKSLVPMQNMFWQLAKNVRITNQKIYTLIRGMLIRSLAYCHYVANFAEHKCGKKIKDQFREKGEIPHYCMQCQIEVFNILFVQENEDGAYSVFCVNCARKTSHLLQDYFVLRQHPFSELNHIFDSFQLHMIPKQLVA